MLVHHQFVETKVKAGLILPLTQIGDVYSAEAQNFSGKGRIKFPNGDVYEGDFNGGKMEGKGLLTSENGDRYHGQFKNGFKHGVGQFQAQAGERYAGTWLYNKREGDDAVAMEVDGSRYEGSYTANQKHG
jgi:hypothetical protein